MLYGVSGFMGVAAVTFSRDLYVETAGLFAIAFMLIYIILTDANHIMPQIKNPQDKNIEKTDNEGGQENEERTEIKQ